MLKTRCEIEQPSASNDTHDDERSMSAHGVSRDGLRYAYRGYRYDRLPDAVAYAELMRTRATPEDSVDTHTATISANVPSAADHALMASLGITFDEGVYRFHTFRYDHLDDAVNYAKLTARRRETGSGA